MYPELRSVSDPFDCIVGGRGNGVFLIGGNNGIALCLCLVGLGFVGGPGELGGFSIYTITDITYTIVNDIIILIHYD